MASPPPPPRAKGLCVLWPLPQVRPSMANSSNKEWESLVLTLCVQIWSVVSLGIKLIGLYFPDLQINWQSLLQEWAMFSPKSFRFLSLYLFFQVCLFSFLFTLKCKYTYFKLLDSCVEQNHDYQWHDGIKRFFKCPCGNRAISLDKLPKKHCR